MNITTLTAQGAAETAAVARLHNRYAPVSLLQGHRVGWRDRGDHIAAQQIHPGMEWPAAVSGVFLDLLGQGVLRTGRDIDNAIQSAREAIHADDGSWYDPDTRGWEGLAPHVWRFLDLTDAEQEALA